jgi:recombinational DNA repair protein (RecF pathway)
MAKFQCAKCHELEDGFVYETEDGKLVCEQCFDKLMLGEWPPEAPTDSQIFQHAEQDETACERENVAIGRLNPYHEQPHAELVTSQALKLTGTETEGKI